MARLGLFDDLVPKQPLDGGTVRPQAAQTARLGIFDDLVPQQQTAPQQPQVAPTVNIGAKGDRRAGDTVQPDLTNSLIQGATLNSSDEIVSGLQAPVRLAINAITGEGPQGLSENFQQAQAREASIRAATEEASPILSTGAEIAGSLTAGGPVAKFIGKGTSATTKAIRGIGAGGAFGGVQAFNTGDGLEDRLDKAKTGAAIGAGLGFATDRAARIAGVTIERFQRSKLARAIPTFENIKKKASKFYDMSERAGVHVKKEAVDSFKTLVNQRLDAKEFIPENFPELTAVLRRIEKVLSFNPSLKRLDKVRGALKKPLASLNKEDRNMAMIVRSSLDEFVDSLQPQHVTSGNPDVAVKFLKEGRKLWAQGSKVETLEFIMDKAKRRAARTGSGSNIENVVRKEFDKILNNRNLSRGFSGEELDAMRVVVEGTKRGNQLRKVGKLAPSGVVSLAGSTGTGATVGATVVGLVAGPAGIPLGAAIGGTALPTVGIAAKFLADRSTRKAAERVMQRVANGGPLNVKTPAQLEQLIRRLVIAQTGQLSPSGP